MTSEATVRARGDDLHDDAEEDIRPVVDLPRSGLSATAIAVLAVIAALGLFLILNNQRRNAAVRPLSSATDGLGTFTPPPPLVVPPEPTPVPSTVTVVTEPLPEPPGPQRPAFTPPPAPAPSPPVFIVPQPAQAPQPQPVERRDAGGGAPALVYDGGTSRSAASAASTADNSQGGGERRDGGTAGGNGQDDSPARATQIGNRTTIMPTGTIIPAVLETPIDTARPGLIRAVISQDTRGFDGTRVLVPRGARLIGEYQSDVRSGQNRVLVNWTRLIRPDGVSIRLGSPAADPLGGAGIPGNVHSFFLQRFASAVLQSALTVGVNLASRPGNGSVIVGLPGSVNNVVGQSLLPGSDLRPKITVKQGAALNVFVARDLDFSGVPSRP